MKIQVLRATEPESLYLVYEGAPEHEYRARYNVDLPASQCERYLRIQREWVQMQMEIKSFGITGLGIEREGMHAN
jgi:hypothetical protein